MTEITMPKLSDTMEEGKVLKWMKSEGDDVKKGEKIVEIETDKADMEVEAFDSGKLGKIVVKAGETAKVGSPIAILDGGAAEAPVAADLQVGQAKEKPTEESVASEPTSPVSFRGEAEETRVEKVAAEAVEKKTTTNVKASPLARRVAEKMSVDLASIAGTGPGGRVTKEDVEKFTGMTPMRKAIAKTVTRSKTEIPHFYLTMAVEMDKAAAAKEDAKKRGDGVKITYTHIITRAVVEAIKKFPIINSSVEDGEIKSHDNINIGILVAVEGGLLIPVVKECERLSMQEVAKTSADLVQRARSGKLSAGELTGGTFTISNVGMLDVEHFQAIIDPPQSAILAVGSIKRRPVVDESGGIKAALLMNMTLSIDHRVLDGEPAARFLTEVRERLQEPEGLM